MGSTAVSLAVQGCSRLSKAIDFPSATNSFARETCDELEFCRSLHDRINFEGSDYFLTIPFSSQSTPIVAFIPTGFWGKSTFAPRTRNISSKGENLTIVFGITHVQIPSQLTESLNPPLTINTTLQTGWHNLLLDFPGERDAGAGQPASSQPLLERPLKSPYAFHHTL
jgi:hypothetical protein